MAVSEVNDVRVIAQQQTNGPSAVLSAGPNLVVNGGFESGSQGWTLTSESSLDFSMAHTGNASLRLATTDQSAIVRSILFPLLPNRFYRFTVAIKAETLAEVRVDQLNASATRLSYAGTMGVLENGDWQVISNTFWSHPKAAQGRVMLMLNGSNGSANFDDVEVILMPIETPYTLGTGAAVDFPGHPSVMGMRIVKAQFSPDGQSFTLETTAAKFELNTTTGVMTCTQILGGNRMRATLQLPQRLSKIKTLVQDADRVILSTDTLDLAFHGDSTVVMTLAPGKQATIRPGFTPKFTGWREGFLTAIDDIGGLAVFPGYQRGTGLTDSYLVSAGAGTPPQSFTYTFGKGGRVALSIFPPRPFDWLTSFEDQIIHTGGYPTKSVLEDWHSIANVVVLHETIWKGKVPKIYFNYDPKSSAALPRVINDAHSLGMKVLLYFSSLYFPAQGRDLFINEVQRLRDQFGFDGVFYDGIARNHWEYAYEVVRRTRDLFPTGRVYLHNSFTAPFGRDDALVFLPQIDSWADYTLKGEGVVMNEWSDPYLNYVARGYNVSNTIGTIKVDNDVEGVTLLVGGVKPTLTELLNGLVDLNMRQRIVAYPSNGVWPPSSSMTQWPDCRARIADMKAKWEVGQPVP